MSTANFYTVNAGAYYAVSDNGIGCGRLLTSGRRRGWDDIHGLRDWDGARNFPALAMMEKSFSVSIGGGQVIDLTGRIVRRSGYYSGAVLDWDIKTSAGSLGDDFRGDTDELAEAVVSDLLYKFRYYDGWNDGLCKIHRPRLLRAVSAGLEQIRREAEALCNWAADFHLICVGRASNGEAFYRRAI